MARPARSVTDGVVMGMAPAQDTRKVYMSVIDDVVEKMRQVFLDADVSESVVYDLKALWTRKLEDEKMVPGRPGAAGGSRGYAQAGHMGQFDGAMDDDDIDGAIDGSDAGYKLNGIAPVSAAAAAASPLPQFDGGADGDDGAAAAAATAAAPPGGAAAAVAAEGGAVAVTEKEVEVETSSDSDSDSGSEGSEEEQVDDLLFCQFEKITHNKTQWRADFRNAVLRSNGKEFVFRRIQGSYIW